MRALMGAHGPFQWAEEGGEACGTWFSTLATYYSPWEVRESPDDQMSPGALNQNLSGGPSRYSEGQPA